MSVSGPAVISVDPSRHLPRGNAHLGSVPSVWLKIGVVACSSEEKSFRVFCLSRETGIDPDRARELIALNEMVPRW